jgi:hypothetical protein
MRLKKLYFLSLGVLVIGSIIFLFVKTDRTEEVIPTKISVLSESGNKNGNLTLKNVNNSPISKVNIQDEKREDELSKKYYSMFDETNAIAETRLAALIQQATKEYKVKKENGRNLTKLSLKYGEIQNRYEETTKSQYDAIILGIQNEISDVSVKSDLGVKLLEHYHMKKEDRKKKLNEELNKLL